MVPEKPGRGPGQHKSLGRDGSWALAGSLHSPGHSHPLQLTVLGGGHLPQQRWPQAGVRASLGLFGAPLGQFRAPKGITHLPSSLVGPIDGTVLHSIETVVIEWFQQVEEIFGQDPAQQLQEGLHPLPRVEFDFWQTRVTSLECISEQVLSHHGGPVSSC